MDWKPRNFREGFAYGYLLGVVVSIPILAAIVREVSR